MGYPFSPDDPPEAHDTYTAPEHGWTCFHCGQTFTHESPARNHFGAKPDAVPGCMLRMQDGEHALLRRIRALEREVAVYRQKEVDALMETIEE